MFHRLIAPLMIICMSCSFASNGASRLFGDSVDPLPAELKNFNGMLLGRLVTKDVERGSFVVQVDAVPRVWRNSRAAKPGSAVGRTVEVHGVFGKFLDVLVVTRKGETLEFECKHDGERLVFPGEMLRKAAPYDPEDFPVLPEEFRGFSGVITATIVKKDPETLEMIVEVNAVKQSGEGNQAQDPESIEGKKMMLAGFWQRKEQYHALKIGDRIEVGTRHISRQSNHLNVQQSLRKLVAEGDGQRMEGRESRMSSETVKTMLSGFRGMLVGTLVEKDVERGTFSIKVEAVPRVWKNNQAAQPKQYIGKEVQASGVQGRRLDVLVVARKGDTLEFGAFDEGGNTMRVVEVLRKTSPVKPGDYPELPTETRGIKGLLRGTVVVKDETMMELIIKVSEVVELFPANQAKDPQKLVGKNIMLVGFWNRKDLYHGLKDGDVIQFGVEHPQRLSDHLNVIESVKKLERN